MHCLESREPVLSKWRNGYISAFKYSPYKGPNLIIIVSYDDLAPDGARPSPDTVFVLQN